MPVLVPTHAIDAIDSHVAEKIDLQSGEKNVFASLLRYGTFPRKHQLLSPGELCKSQYFVVKGCLRIFYLDASGVEHNAKFAIENWWGFDIESFFESTPAYYGIDCLEDTEVLILNKEDHAELMEKVPSFERFYRLMMQQSFVALQYRMTQGLSLPAEERYLRFQEKYPGLESRISQKQIASYLGITPVFLSMLRKKNLVKH